MNLLSILVLIGFLAACFLAAATGIFFKNGTSACESRLGGHRIGSSLPSGRPSI